MMGTRNLVCVVKNGEFKVAQYGQWDGYPTGQGDDVVEFLLKMDRSRFERHLDNVKVLTDAEASELWDDTENPEKNCPQLSANTGAGILDYVDKTPHPQLRHMLDFAGDSLFCEWAYVVDLDNDTLEVYKGFNTTGIPKGERFENAPFEKNKPDKKGWDGKPAAQYYPIKLVKKYPFKELTPTTMGDLESELSEADE